MRLFIFLLWVQAVGNGVASLLADHPDAHWAAHAILGAIFLSAAIICETIRESR